MGVELIKFVPVRKSITTYRGDTFNLPFRLTRSNYDFTGTTIKIDIKTADEYKTLIISKSPSLQITTGQILFEWLISASEMANIEPGSYIYDLETTQNGIVRTIQNGLFNIVDDVTK